MADRRMKAERVGRGKPDPCPGLRQLRERKVNSWEKKTMQTSLFDYFEFLTRAVEGSVTRLSLWVGMDMTWPLIILIGITFYLGISSPNRCIRGSSPAARNRIMIP